MTPYTRLKPIFQAKAKENQVVRKGEQARSTNQKSDELIKPTNTHKELAKVAGVSKVIHELNIKSTYKH